MDGSTLRKRAFQNRAPSVLSDRPMMMYAGALSVKSGALGSFARCRCPISHILRLSRSLSMAVPLCLFLHAWASFARLGRPQLDCFPHNFPLSALVGGGGGSGEE